MIRTITRPSTAACTLPMYIGFLLSEPHATSCLRLGSLLNISHDSVNRFLNRESYTPRDMFDEAKSILNLIGGVLSVDDSVLDKPYSNYVAYVGYYYSGKHHAVVKGINLITLYYTDPQGNHQPVSEALAEIAFSSFLGGATSGQSACSLAVGSDSKEAKNWRALRD